MLVDVALLMIIISVVRNEFEFTSSAAQENVNVVRLCPALTFFSSPFLELAIT